MPVILPAMIQLGLDPIRYGVLLVINLEIALITPSVGMNLFTIKAITNTTLGPIIRGALPSVALMLAVLIIVTSEAHTSKLQSLMRTSYVVCSFKKKLKTT